MSEANPKFEVLPGLPTYGPLAEPFSATGQGTHREGFVVRFFLSDGTSWVGNFQGELPHFSGVFQHPATSALFIVARGQGYLVDPSSRKCTHYFGGMICKQLFFEELQLLIFGNGLEYGAYGAEGWLWNTRRISWDETRNERFVGQHLHGEALDFTSEESWVPFTIDLLTGEATGGCYRMS